MPKPNFFQELKRRNVIKAAISYLVISFAVLEAADIVFPIFNISDVVLRWLFIILGIGFPIWLIFAWLYQLTPEGIKKTTNLDPKNSITKKTSNRLNQVIIAALSIAVVLLFAYGV